MTPRDQYPETIEFEFDRPRLTRYWRIQALLGCCIPFPIAAAMFGVMITSARVEKSSAFDAGQIMLLGLRNVGLGAVVGLLIGLMWYFLLCHYQSKRRATNLRLIVEGPYLRVISGGAFIIDRRIHFRSLCDYSTQEGPLLKRMGMKTLSFQVVGSARSIGNMIPGLVDPTGVRDTLCEIDAAREG